MTTVTEQSGLPRVSDTVTSKQLTTADGQIVTVIHVPKLNLHVITDRGQLGPNWIEVDVHNRIYSTRFLAGADEDMYSALARRFAQCIIGTSSSRLLELLSNQN
jgi:hypothetical protein